MNTGFAHLAFPCGSNHRYMQYVLPQLSFSFYRHQPIRADFSEGQIASDAGLLPLRAFDHRHHLTRGLAAGLSYPQQHDRLREDRLCLAVAPTPAQRTLAKPASSAHTHRPKALFHVGQKVLEMLGDRCNLRHGCKLLSGNGFCLSGKANLLPLAVYTIEFTSPAIWALMLPRTSRRWMGVRSSPSPRSRPGACTWRRGNCRRSRKLRVSGTSIPWSRR